jgi:soluble lytic murein transglycosylase
MRGIDYTLSCLPKARVFIAGAAMLAGAFTSTAHGQSPASGNGKGTQAADETAYAAPRVPERAAPEVAFPQPLTPGDVALMRRIFAFQAAGNIPEAVRSSAELENPLLLGTVLANRYLGHFHRSTADELSDWLLHYSDLPDATPIRALLLARLPNKASPPPASEAAGPGRFSEPEPVPEDIDPPGSDIVRDPMLDRTVIDRAQRGNWTSALRLIVSARSIPPAYAAQLRAEVAQILFVQNEDINAELVADLAVAGVPAVDQPGLGFYIGGLAAWRLHRIELARTKFEGGATASKTSPPLRAASAFWASRVSRRLNDLVGTVKWLEVAAGERLTLHGLLARRILRLDPGSLLSGGLLSQADVDAVVATPHGLRAFALLQIGQPGRAEAEIRALWPKAWQDPVFGQSLMMVTASAGFTDSATQMVELLQSRDGDRRVGLGIRMPQLRPAGGFSIDPALVYAVTRLESNFDTEAVSPSGARGLMQIMPATAQYITGDLLYAPERLHEASLNLAIGQRYLSYLSRQDGIDRNLIKMLASYNSGPGNFLRWGSEVHDNSDPLLFIEAIPVTETRAFVYHALVYSWIYAARMHLPAPSLDDLAAGEFPRFTPLEQERRMKVLQPALH